MTREITIQPVLNGYLCNVGCQRVVFESREKLLAELSKYLAAPKTTEQHYIQNAVNEMKRPEEPTMQAQPTADTRLVATVIDAGEVTVPPPANRAILR